MVKPILTVSPTKNVILPATTKMMMGKINMHTKINLGLDVWIMTFLLEKTKNRLGFQRRSDELAFLPAVGQSEELTPVHPGNSQ
jgi:hypothetical protein